MINIILSCSQQKTNRCVMGDTEQDHTYLIAEATAEILKNYDCNVCLIPKISGGEIDTLYKVANISNDFVTKNPGQSFHIDIHTDGGYNGAGASGFYLSEAGKNLTLHIHRQISAITPWSDGNVSQRSLYVLKNTKAVASLIEVSFHDKPEQAKWIHENINLIAQAIVKGLEGATGIIKKYSASTKIDIINQIKVLLDKL